MHFFLVPETVLYRNRAAYTFFYRGTILWCTLYRYKHRRSSFESELKIYSVRTFHPHKYCTWQHSRKWETRGACREHITVNRAYTLCGAHAIFSQKGRVWISVAFVVATTASRASTSSPQEHIWARVYVRSKPAIYTYPHRIIPVSYIHETSYGKKCQPKSTSCRIHQIHFISSLLEQSVEAL